MNKKAITKVSAALIVAVIIIAILAGALVMVTTLPPPAPPPPTPPPPGPATITGKVMDAKTGTPIAGASVKCDGYSATTGSDGTYSLSVKVGSYTVTVSMTGYETRTASVSATEAKTYTASISLPLTAPEKIEYSIGIAIAVSGAAYAVEGPFRRDAALLAIEHVNEMLTAADSPVRFKPIHEDTKGTAEGALASLELLAAAGVKVVVGPLSSAEVSAIKSFADSKKIVSISPSATSPKLAVAGDYIFRMCPTDIPQAKALAQMLSQLGYTKVAIMGRNDDYGKGIADLFEKLFTGTVKRLMYTPGLPDYATEVGSLSSTVRELGADEKTAVLIIAFDVDGLNIVGHARLDPTLSKVKWFGSESLKRPTFIPPQAPKENGDFLVAVQLTGFFASPEKNPVTISFEKAYKAKFGKDPSPYSYFAYDCVWVACLSVLAAGKYDGDAVKAVLPRVAESYMGASGYKKLDENGDVAGADYRIWRVVVEADEYKFKELGVWYFTTEKISWY
mgnify:CR=1 FL=1